jgi:hypothetical protein
MPGIAPEQLKTRLQSYSLEAVSDYYLNGEAILFFSIFPDISTQDPPYPLPVSRTAEERRERRRRLPGPRIITCNIARQKVAVKEIPSPETN